MPRSASFFSTVPAMIVSVFAAPPANQKRALVADWLCPRKQGNNALRCGTRLPMFAAGAGPGEMMMLVYALPARPCLTVGIVVGLAIFAQPTIAAAEANGKSSELVSHRAVY